MNFIFDFNDLKNDGACFNCVVNLMHLQIDLYKLYNEILFTEDICVHFINQKELELELLIEQLNTIALMKNADNEETCEYMNKNRKIIYNNFNLVEDLLESKNQALKVLPLDNSYTTNSDATSVNPTFPH